MGLKPLGRGLGVGGRKRKNVGVKARGKRDASWGKKKSKSKKCKCEDGLIFFSRLIVSGMLRWCKLLGLFLPSKKKLP